MELLQQRLDTLPVDVMLVAVSSASLPPVLEQQQQQQQKGQHLQEKQQRKEQQQIRSTNHNTELVGDYQLTTDDVKFGDYKLRMHVPVDDPSFGQGAGCKQLYFTRSRVRIPRVYGWRLLTVDMSDKKAASSSDNFLVSYLVRDDNDEQLRSIVAPVDSEDSLATGTQERLIPIEINVCPCVTKSTGKLPGGTIILAASEQELQDITSQRLPYHTDTLEQLLTIQVRELLTDERCNFVLKAVLRELDKLHLTDMYLLVAVDDKKDGKLTLSAGKRHPFESSEQCAIRELREEFALVVDSLYAEDRPSLVASGVRFFFASLRSV